MSIVTKLGSGNKKAVARKRRHTRVRKKVTGTASRPRLVVSRSSRHLFVQVVDDSVGHHARVRVHHGGRPALRSTVTRAPRPRRSASCSLSAPSPLAVDTVVFDRGGNKYHGRVAALADGAREGGLAF